MTQCSSVILFFFSDRQREPEHLRRAVPSRSGPDGERTPHILQLPVRYRQVQRQLHDQIARGELHQLHPGDGRRPQSPCKLLCFLGCTFTKYLVGSQASYQVVNVREHGSILFLCSCRCWWVVVSTHPCVPHSCIAHSSQTKSLRSTSTTVSCERTKASTWSRIYENWVCQSKVSMCLLLLRWKLTTLFMTLNRCSEKRVANVLLSVDDTSAGSRRPSAAEAQDEVPEQHATSGREATHHRRHVHAHCERDDWGTQPPTGRRLPRPRLVHLLTLHNNNTLESWIFSQWRSVYNRGLAIVIVQTTHACQGYCD